MRLEKQKRLIEEFEDKLGSRLAFNGLEPTLRALMRGQARILLVSDGFGRAGYKCPDSGFLVLEEREGLCPEGIKPLPVIDIVDEAIEEALGQKAEVVLVVDQEFKKKIQGVGAILRYTI
jgi:peptide subunit release factor 1 (eRF1)